MNQNYQIPLYEIERLQRQQYALMERLREREPTLFQKMVRAGMFAGVGFLGGMVLGIEPASLALAAAAASGLKKTAERKKNVNAYELMKIAEGESHKLRNALIGAGAIGAGVIGARMNAGRIGKLYRAGALTKGEKITATGLKGNKEYMRRRELTSGMKNMSFMEASGLDKLKKIFSKKPPETGATTA